MNTKMVRDITLKDIIEKRIEFVKNNDIFNKEEYRLINQGELLAYSEMTNDLNFMTVHHFVLKYTQKISEINNKGEKNEMTDKICGYNNAIVFVLSLIDPIYEYEL